MNFLQNKGIDRAGGGGGEKMKAREWVDRLNIQYLLVGKCHYLVPYIMQIHHTPVKNI